MSDRWSKIMFLLGALWNVGGGIAILLLPELLFARQGLELPDPPVYYQSWIALFMTFGVGYYLVSREPRKNHNIIVLGIIGKLAFAAIFIANMVAAPGKVPWLFGIAVAGDLVFVLLFWLALLGERIATGEQRASAHE